MNTVLVLCLSQPGMIVRASFTVKKRGVTTYSETSDSEDEDIGNGSSVGSKVCK